MKILRDNTIWVQKNDIVHFSRLNLDVPFSIKNSVTFVNDSNRYDFVKFTGAAEIKFLDGLSWIVNFDDVKDLTIEELEKKFNELADKRCTLVDKFNKIAKEEKYQNMYMIDECENLTFLMLCINDIILCKQGRLDMEPPADMETPRLVEKEPKKSKGFQKIFKRNKKN